MKKILLAVTAMALLAVSCNNKNGESPASAAGPATETEQNGGTATSGDIAYFNIDSLVSRYDMYLDLKADYEAKAKKADAELTSKGRSLENDIRDFQEKVQKGLVTSSQAQTMQDNLSKKQNAFVEHRDKVMGEMAEEEQVMLNKIHYSITEYLKKFNSDFRFKMILSSTTGGGPVMSADPSLDITQVLLDGMNEEYAASRPSGAKAKADK